MLLHVGLLAEDNNHAMLVGRAIFSVLLLLYVHDSVDFASGQQDSFLCTTQSTQTEFKVVFLSPLSVKVPTFIQHCDQVARQDTSEFDFKFFAHTISLGARTLLVAPGLTTRNTKLLGAPGIATRSDRTLVLPHTISLRWRPSLVGWRPCLPVAIMKRQTFRSLSNPQVVFMSPTA